MNKKHILIFLCAIALHLSGYFFIIKRTEPFQYFSYLVFWWSYILFIDNLISVRTNRFIIFNRDLPFLVIISSGFWCVFEVINLRLENWFYINLPDYLPQRWAGYLLAYGTVIPAISGTKELVRSFLGKTKVTARSLSSCSLYAIFLGLLALACMLFFPRYCFPLAWIFPALILDGYNNRRGYASFIGERQHGFSEDLISTLSSGLICGILWETWNFWSISKWVYSVPFFENIKIFEMPIPGYLGFLTFAVGTIAFVNLLQGMKAFKTYLIRTTLLALAFSLVSFALIDRYTVFSYVARLDQLSFIDKARLDALKASGVKTSFGIDLAVIDEKEKAALGLVHLKGLGYNNYLKLKTHGVNSTHDLSQLDENSLSQILDEPNLRRIRVYTKEARQ